MAEADAPKPPFPSTFWTANVTELFERAAYYSMASFVVIYLGRLGLGDYWPSTLNGLLWFLVYFLPVLSGTIADQVLTIAADSYIPVDDELIPTADAPAPVEGRRFVECLARNQVLVSAGPDLVHLLGRRPAHAPAPEELSVRGALFKPVLEEKGQVEIALGIRRGGDGIGQVEIDLVQEGKAAQKAAFPVQDRNPRRLSHGREAGDRQSPRSGLGDHGQHRREGQGRLVAQLRIENEDAEPRLVEHIEAAGAIGQDPGSKKLPGPRALVAGLL